MKDFVRGESFKAGFRHTRDCDRISNRVKNLDRIAKLPAVGGGMAVNDGGHVAASEIFFRDVLRQSYLFKMLEFHGQIPLFGYRVMNFVMPFLDSVIHTVFTRNATPLGPVKEAVITKYSP